MMNQAQFAHLVEQGYSHVLVTRVIDTGERTPLDIFRVYSEQNYSFLLESLAEGVSARFSFIGLPCTERLEIRGKTFYHIVKDEIQSQQSADDPFALLREFYERYRVANHEDLPHLNGGLVGCFAYECIRYFEPNLRQNKPPDVGTHPLPETPEVVLLVAQQLIVFDHANASTTLVVVSPAQENGWQIAQQQLDTMEQNLHSMLKQQHPSTNPEPAAATKVEPYSSFSTPDYNQAIEKIKDYIVAGDVMQVVLSRSMSAPLTKPPIEFYAELRRLNPSPYMYYFNFGDYQLAGSSPETLVRTDGKTAVLRPLAGTRHRGKTPAEDQRLTKDLLADEKECAEHLMLIDLGRNDLGRVCQIGTVVTTEKMKVEYYSHVMHIVSNVVGTVPEQATPWQLLRSVFPAGTLSGAPKFRAMEIIDELEPCRRGFYGGAVGYVAWNGTMDLAITIRTALLCRDRLYFQAGGGIVADSVAELEFQETVNKSRIVLQAAARAHD